MEVLEEQVDESSSTSHDSEFLSKYISPRDKAKLNSRIVYPRDKAKSYSRTVVEFASEEIVHQRSPSTTIHKNCNSESKLVRDLNKNILYQNNVIADLRNKLGVIRDILNDSTTYNHKSEVNVKDK